MGDFRRTSDAYPEELRTQLWPLCCGASILSGFKDVGTLTDAELTKEIQTACSSIPDNQVYKGEGITPKLTYLTLNSGQTQSKKIMDAVTKAGFVLFATASPRGQVQSFFVRDMSRTFTMAEMAAPIKASKVSPVAA